MEYSLSRRRCQREREHLLITSKELADGGVNAEGDNVLAAADLRPSEREREGKKKSGCSPTAD